MWVFHLVSILGFGSELGFRSQKRLGGLINSTFSPYYMKERRGEVSESESGKP